MKKICKIAMLAVSVALVIELLACKTIETKSSSMSSAGSSEDFVKISAGTMALNQDGSYLVTLTKPFEICDHEVTQAEYEKYCMYYEYTPDARRGVGDNYPVYYVSWYDAIVYCNLRSLDDGFEPCYKLAGETDPKKWKGIVKDNETNPQRFRGPDSMVVAWCWC